MDHAVALVQAYLQLNGYFTSAEYPIVASAGRCGVRSITDVDVLAFRFPSGFPTGRPLPRPGKKAPRGLDLSELDPGLGAPPDAIDMVIGEVKEGRVGLNSGIRNPDVLRAVISRLGDESHQEQVVQDLLHSGVARTTSGVVVRLIAFGSFPPGDAVPPCRIISLGHALTYLQSYVRKHWNVLRHLQFKDPAFGFLMTLEKARRGGAAGGGGGGGGAAGRTAAAALVSSRERVSVMRCSIGRKSRSCVAMRAIPFRTSRSTVKAASFPLAEREQDTTRQARPLIGELTHQLVDLVVDPLDDGPHLGEVLGRHEAVVFEQVDDHVAGEHDVGELVDHAFLQREAAFGENVFFDEHKMHSS